MRLKSFTAASTKDALAKVREALGEDAIIVNMTEPDGRGRVRVTAAIERQPETEPLSELEEAPPAAPPVPFDLATLSAMLRYHGLPSALATRIQTAASGIEAESLAEGLSAGLETLYSFKPVGGAEARPLIFVGPPGAGKTLSVAKLAADAIVAGQPVRLVTMDMVRAGGLEQLEQYARLMRLPVESAEHPDDLRACVGDGEDEPLTLIDTVGANPYSIEDVQSLARAIKISGAEPVMVVPAGTDALEAAEMAGIFASLGAKRMIATRLDGARRYAGILTALYRGGFALGALGTGPFVADGLAPATSLELARRIIAKPDPERISQLKKKAIS